MEGEGERTGGKGKERDGGREAHTYARTLSSLKILVKMFLLVSSGRDIRFSEGNKFTITEKFSRPNRIKKNIIYIYPSCRVLTSYVNGVMIIMELDCVSCV